MTNWICSQYGAREHYAIARALHLQDKLRCLYTDIWLRPGSIASRISGRTRYHQELKDANIHSFNSLFLANKLLKFNSKEDDCYDWLTALSLPKASENNSVLFTYSYSGRRLLKKAKQLGYKTVLGQINPGPLEAELVKELYAAEYGSKYPPEVPTDHYWELWEEEVANSDQIIVNSQWSAKLMIDHGIAAHKINVVPLAYEPQHHAVTEAKTSPPVSPKRPLKLLYLGAISIRKGFHILKAAMQQLKGAPVELHVVGRLNGPEELLQQLPHSIIWHREVAPHQVRDFFIDCDLFILPTFSDGFALTLLESQHCKCPIITTPYCGEVITQGLNGSIIQNITANHIAEQILRYIDQPELIAIQSQNSIDLSDYSILALQKRLNLLENKILETHS